MPDHSKRTAEDLADIFIPTRQVKRAFMTLDIIMDQAIGKDHAGLGLVVGEPGTGKTRLVKEWAATRLGLPDFPVPGERLRITYTEVTEVSKGAGAKSLGADVLGTLHDPHPDVGTLPERIQRIRRAIHPPGGERTVDGMVLDEFHRVFDAARARVNREAAGWLTNILNLRLCPLFLVGEPAIEAAFQPILGTTKTANSQLKRRTNGVVHLSPYRWADAEDQKEFRAILHQIDVHAGMPELAGLASTDMALRVHAFSGGLPGQTAQLIQAARTIARRLRLPMLSKDVFAEAVDMLRLSSERKRRPNPFRIANPDPGDTEEENRR